MSENFTENNPYKRKKKKRKNFLKNAKKYAKKGQMGRGTKMSEELYQYFVGILDVMKKGIENKDERQTLVNNVLERTKDEELDVIGNQLGCRVVELLLPFSSAEDLERYMTVTFPHLRRLSVDNFTSHVIETLLRVACNRATENFTEESEEPQKKRKKTDSEYSEEHIQQCYEFTLKMAKYTLNNLESFVTDQYANHILRSVLKCLSGISLLPGEKPKVNIFKDSTDTNKGIPPHTTSMEYKPVPAEFKDLVKEFATRLSSWPQFKELPFNNITSGLLQVLLYAVKNVDKNLTRDIIKKLLNEAFAPEDWIATGAEDEKKDKINIDAGSDEESKSHKTGGDEGNGDNQDIVPDDGLPPVFKSQPAVRLLEASLFVAKKKTYTQLYARCFINRLAKLSVMPSLNFTVQRLFDNVQVKEEFEAMYSEISSHEGAVLAGANTGVLVAIARACLRLQTRQAQFINNLESALKCTSPEDQKYLSVCCLRLLPVTSIDVTALDKEYFIHVHGSVILQTLLDFQRPTKAVTSLLELSSDQLMVILCDVKGCHVADAFCSGRYVGVKARDKMIWKLKGHYQKLALSQHGSRALEQIFAVAALDQKIKIMSEISDKSNLLNSTQYGRIIAEKLDVETFKTSQKKWEQSWKKKEEKAKMKEQAKSQEDSQDQ